MIARAVARRTARDDGNSVIEFVVLTAFFLIPLVYIMLAVFRVQGFAYGATEATREAARAFVSADNDSEAYSRACAAATLALQNQVDDPFDCKRQLEISTSCAPDRPDPCEPGLQPGNTVHVEIDLSVGLPLLPTSVFGKPLTIPLHSTHDEVVDTFRAPR